MRVSSKLSVLISEIEQGIAVLEKNERFLNNFFEQEYPILKRSQASAIIIIAKTITSYSTCAETIFLRISRFFENSLEKDKWHTDLLHKMVLDLNKIRPAVISEQTFSILNELMRFRQFKRYYFEFEYDWDRLDFLMKKYEQVKSLLKSDLKQFVNFLSTLYETDYPKT